MPATVMIVDDSKLARIVVSKAISELQPDWTKVEASSAAEALALIEKHDIDVALIDFNMSEKDGLELAAELRVVRPNMPLAIVTANVQDEIIARARAIGAGFVPKPVTADGLEPFISGTALSLRSKRL